MQGLQSRVGEVQRPPHLLNKLPRPWTGLPVTGKYNATNAMVAAYVAKHLGVTEENILSALANLRLTKNRTEWKANGADILSDVYNANQQP